MYRPKLPAPLLGIGLLLTACFGSGGDLPAPKTENHPPVAAFTSASTVQAGTPLAFDAMASSDPDGDALHFSWAFGDGSGGGSATLAHVYSKAGTFTVELTATDPAGASTAKAQVVTVSARPEAGAAVNVLGKVRDSSGASLAGARVELVGSSSAGTSDAAGQVTLSLPTGTPNTLRVSKVGYAEQFRVLALPGTANSGFFEVALAVRGPQQTLDAGTGGSLTGSDGAKLILPAGALTGAAGATVSGTVNVALTPVDVTDPAKVTGFPGAFEGVNPSGALSPIVSFGTTEYALSQGNERLQLAPGRTAVIELPIYAALNLDGSVVKVGDTQPLWSLDERSGLWVQEGSGVVVASSSPSGLALRATVAHFSWWNADLGFVPARPKPRCEPDTTIPGTASSFANETICNMIAEMDRGVAGLSTGLTPQANPPRLPGYRASATVPLAGGVGLAIPADVGVILRGCALGGTWCGQVTLRQAAGSSDEVVIKLRPLDQTSDFTVAISSPASPAYAGDSVTFGLTVGGGLLPDKIEFFSDGVLIGTPNATSFTWFTGSVPEGPHVVTAKVTLGVRTVTSAPLTVRVDHSIPTVTLQTPTPGGLGGSASPIQAVFSEALLPASLTDTSVILKVNDASVARTLALSGDGRTLTITPSVPLPVPASLSVTLGSGASGLTDLARNPVTLPATPWSWTTSVWSSLGGRVEGSLGPLSIPAPSMALGTDGQPVVAFAAQPDSSSSPADLHVRRFDGAAWQAVGAPLSAASGPGKFGSDQSGVACSAVAVDASNTLYVAWQELTDDAQTTYAYYARRYNAGSGLWEALGEGGGRLPETAFNPCTSLSLAVDSQNHPVVAYTAKSGLLVKRFGGASWAGLGPNEGNLGRLDFQGFNMALNAAGNPVLVGNEQNGSAFVKRYNPAQNVWEPLGPYGGKLQAAGLTLGTPKLVLDGTGNPLVAGTVSVPYGSAVTSSDVTLFRFTGTDWQEIGPRAASFGVAAGQVAAVGLDAADQPVLAYVGLPSDTYNLYVRRYTGSGWQGVGTDSGKVGITALGWLTLGTDAGKLTLVFNGLPTTVSVIRFP